MVRVWYGKSVYSFQQETYISQLGRYVVIRRSCSYRHDLKTYCEKIIYKNKSRIAWRKNIPLKNRRILYGIVLQFKPVDKQKLSKARNDLFEIRGASRNWKAGRDVYATRAASQIELPTSTCSWIFYRYGMALLSLYFFSTLISNVSRMRLQFNEVIKLNWSKSQKCYWNGYEG